MKNFKRFNRVELLMQQSNIEPAIETFGALLGIRFPPLIHVPEAQVSCAISWEAGIEIFGPNGPDSPMHASLARKSMTGAIGPIVWEVDDIDAIRPVAERMGVGILYQHVHENGGRQLSLNPADCFGYTLTFLERPAGTREPAPGSGAHILRLNRVEMLLPAEDLDAARDFFMELLGVEFGPYLYRPEHHVRTITNWDAKIELMGPGDADSVLHQSLERKGRRGAIGPIVWEVADLDRMEAHALSLGHKLLYKFEDKGRRQMSLSPETLFGYTATFTQLP